MDGHVAKPIQAAELFATLTRAAVLAQAEPSGNAAAAVA
jgi:hypothetical protein